MRRFAAAPDGGMLLQRSAARPRRSPVPKAAGKESVTPADIIDAPDPKRKNGKAGPAKVARGYFEAIAKRDLDAMLTFWNPDGIENISTVGVLSIPDGVREFFGGMFTALPDGKM